MIPRFLLDATEIFASNLWPRQHCIPFATSSGVGRVMAFAQGQCLGTFGQNALSGGTVGHICRHGLAGSGSTTQPLPPGTPASNPNTVTASLVQPPPGTTGVRYTSSVGCAIVSGSCNGTTLPDCGAEGIALVLRRQVVAATTAPARPHAHPDVQQTGRTPSPISAGCGTLRAVRPRGCADCACSRGSLPQCDEAGLQSADQVHWEECQCMYLGIALNHHGGSFHTLFVLAGGQSATGSTAARSQTCSGTIRRPKAILCLSRRKVSFP
eukprot:m.730753 g.730753  ORF g.730753 m.730753 type:complete len:268 (+) comp23056_c0_seq10:2623-3426(+)